MSEEPVIKRRNIIYPRIELRTGHLELILPNDADEKQILEKYAGWIDEKQQQIEIIERESQNLSLSPRTKDEYASLIKELAGKKTGRPVKIQMRKMKSKWASCSPNGTITVNTLGQNLPDNYVQYIISHEILHLTHRKHDALFLAVLENEFPNMAQLEKDLAGYWFRLNKEI